MSPRLRPEVEAAFLAAIELPAAQQDAFVARECGSDPALRAEVLSLLRNYRAAGDFLEPASPRSEQGSADDGETRARSALPNRIGRYQIIRLIGEGGMGLVYQAEQQQPRRTVALKVIKGAFASAEMLRRFEQESQALGRLQHPGIAQIYEAGMAESGCGLQPYFAMEFIRGASLLQYAESQRLSSRQRLDLMTKVCDAVQHAHERGIIHRDLKPGNIWWMMPASPRFSILEWRAQATATCGRPGAPVGRTRWDSGIHESRAGDGQLVGGGRPHRRLCTRSDSLSASGGAAPL